jgi:hypothetical protein
MNGRSVREKFRRESGVGVGGGGRSRKDKGSGMLGETKGGMKM